MKKPDSFKQLSKYKISHTWLCIFSVQQIEDDFKMQPV